MGVEPEMEEEEMEFYKKYREVVDGKQNRLPGVEMIKLNTVLHNCDVKDSLPVKRDGPFCDCPQNCPVCDGTFFPSLLKDMSDIIGYFNNRAQKLLQLHLASGFQKCFIWVKSMLQGNHVAIIQEGKDLVTYAMINAIAIQKILNNYDKVHCSKKGEKFRLEAQTMQLEILKSPWLRELMAFYINSNGKSEEMTSVPGLFEDCSLQLDIDNKPSLSATLFDSIKLSVDLTCSICLETVFDPVSLACSHIFCYMCACSAASVSIVDGLKTANPRTRCPLCRRAGVFRNVVHLEELNLLLSRSVPEYWGERIKREREERIQKVKEHWEAQYRAFMGI